MATAGAIKAGKAFIELTVENNLQKPLRAAAARLRSFGAMVGATGGAMIGAGAGLVAPLIGATVGFAKTGDALAKMRDRTGVSVEALSQLSYAAGQSGSDAATLEKGLIGMARSTLGLEQGLAASKELFGELGLSMADLQGLSPDEQFKLIADRLSKVEDPTKKAALAMGVFGKAGQKLLPMINAGADGIEEMQKRAHDLGLTLSDEDANAAAEFTDRLDDVTSMVGAAKTQIGAALAPALTSLLKITIPVVKQMLGFVKANRGVVTTIAAVGAGLAVAGGVLVGIAGGAMALSLVLSGMAAAAGMVVPVLTAIGGGLAFLVSPIGLVIAGVMAAVAAWLYFSGTGSKVAASIRKTLGDVLGFAKKVFGGITDALMAGDFALAGKIAMASLKTVFLGGVAELSNIVGGQFGDMLGTIGTQIAGGDFAGAWETAVMGMAMIWDGFVEGIVAAFTEASRAVVNLWQDTVSSITDFILEDAASGGVFGSIALAGTGIDMQKEQGRAEAMRQQEIANARKQVSNAEQEAVAARDATFAGRDQAEVDQMIAPTRDLLFTAGVDQRSADSTARELAAFAADVADAQQIDAQVVVSDLQAALRGELDALDQYQLTIDTAAVNAELERLAIDPTQATEAERAQATAAAITRQAREQDIGPATRANREEQAQLRVADEFRRRLDELNALPPPSVLDDAQADARRQIGDVADGLRGTLDDMAKEAQRQTDESAAAFKERTAGGAEYANDELAKAQRELDALIAEAKALRETSGAVGGEAFQSLLGPDSGNALLAAHDAGVAAMQQADQFTASQGTFNSYTLGRLGSVAKKDKTEDNTERTADAVEGLLEGAKRGDFQLTVTD